MLKNSENGLITDESAMAASKRAPSSRAKTAERLGHGASACVDCTPGFADTDGNPATRCVPLGNTYRAVPASDKPFRTVRRPRPGWLALRKSSPETALHRRTLHRKSQETPVARPQVQSALTFDADIAEFVLREPGAIH